VSVLHPKKKFKRHHIRPTPDMNHLSNRMSSDILYKQTLSLQPHLSTHLQPIYTIASMTSCSNDDPNCNSSGLLSLSFPLSGCHLSRDTLNWQCEVSVRPNPELLIRGEGRKIVLTHAVNLLGMQLPPRASVLFKRRSRWGSPPSFGFLVGPLKNLESEEWRLRRELQC